MNSAGYSTGNKLVVAEIRAEKNDFLSSLFFFLCLLVDKVNFGANDSMNVYGRASSACLNALTTELIRVVVFFLSLLSLTFGQRNHYLEEIDERIEWRQQQQRQHKITWKNVIEHDVSSSVNFFYSLHDHNYIAENDGNDIVQHCCSEATWSRNERSQRRRRPNHINWNNNARRERGR